MRLTTTAVTTIDLEAKQLTVDTVAELQALLASVILPWEADTSHPPNYVRKTGVGAVVAKVDRWCGGYQDPHVPHRIGWKAHCGNEHASSTVKVRNPHDKRCIDEALQAAKDHADAILHQRCPNHCVMSPS